MNTKLLQWFKNTSLGRPLEKKLKLYLSLVYLIVFILCFRFGLSTPNEKKALLLSEIKVLQEERDRLQSTVSAVRPETAQPSAALQGSFGGLSGLLSRSRLKLVESRFSPVEQEGTLSKQAVALSLTGPFPAFGSFLEAVELLNPPLVIGEISIIVNESKISHVSVDLKGDLYGSVDN